MYHRLHTWLTTHMYDWRDKIKLAAWQGVLQGTGDTGRAAGGLDLKWPFCSAVGPASRGEEKGRERAEWREGNAERAAGCENHRMSHHARNLPLFIQLLHLQIFHGGRRQWDGLNFTEKVRQFGAYLQRSQGSECLLVHLKILSLLLRNHDRWVSYLVQLSMILIFENSVTV